MQIENQITVADARDAFYQWNRLQLERYVTAINKDASRYIEIIPFLLQINNRLLPGYVGVDTPIGVFGYVPDKASLHEIKLLNNKFRYHQEGVIKNYSVESIMFQQKLYNKKYICWIFYRSSLNKGEVISLKEKVKKISLWFISKGLKIEFLCLSHKEFSNNKIKVLQELKKPVFLQSFYSEAVIIAGKYPVWWLVAAEKEHEYTAFVEHIKQARYVDNEEFIDLGTTSGLVHDDIVKTAVELVQKLKQAPEICLTSLLVADQMSFSLPEIDGMATRLKNDIYAARVGSNPTEIMAQIMRDTFSRYSDEKHILSPIRLFSRLRSIPGELNSEIVDAFLADEYLQDAPATGIDHLIAYLNFFKAVSYEVNELFGRIVHRYYEKNTTELDQTLMSVTQNMLLFLSDNSDRVPLYNNKDKAEIILDRILLKHEIFSESDDRWSLLLELSEGNEKKIDGFSSLLGLLAWCWLNRVVNNTTQVSIDCPKQQVKQTQAHHVLEVLIQQLNPDMLSTIPAEAFENSVRPLKSLLFINFIEDTNKESHITSAEEFTELSAQPKKLITHSEQLIINSWGDVYTRQYSSDAGIVKCLCEWTHSAPINSLSKPQPLLIFGHGAGDSTYMAQRVEQVYTGILNYFYHARQEDGRFVLRMGSEYYVITVDDSLLKPHKIGKQRALMNYLEAASEYYQITALDKQVLPEQPLCEIYQKNKKNVLQIFFQLINQSCHTWALDENGSLWSSVEDAYERESYLLHWLYFFKNIRNRLKTINYQNKEFPTLEINQISLNQLGGKEFYVIGADSLTKNSNFLDIQIKIVGHESGDQLSLICDGRKFDYKELKQNVLIECVQYLSARMISEGRQPVYVTDIDVPLRMFNVDNREQIQISHILKFKGNFEKRILKLLDV
jgi:adenylate cyclase, class 1